jgi:Glycosyl transferase family 2
MVALVGAPTFTVIIATYNWSAALKLALLSVLDQTDPDFEVLVVGDHCTDESEGMVSALGDARLNWVNLPQNCGSQWGPNNAGLRMAKGKYIAYLGHDDLWYPTHLQVARATFDRTGADVIAAATLLYGPPESGIRAVTGFWPNNQFTPIQFFPPSSLLHRPEVAHRIGGWVGPTEARAAVDYDFLVRCHESGASFATTGEVSVFKFNAAWRRNAYGTRDVAEQAHCLAAMRRDSQAYRSRELTGALRAATEDRLLKIETPWDTRATATAGALLSRKFKGSHGHLDALSGTVIEAPVCFPCEDEYSAFEWHAVEKPSTADAFRWTGPSTKSVRALPVRMDKGLAIAIRVFAEMKAGLLAAATLRVNGAVAETKIEDLADAGFLWAAQICPEQLPDDDRDVMLIEICVPTTHRPLDFGTSADRRWLGLAIGWIEISPLH